jgi:transposase
VSLLVMLLMDKYVYHMPLYRQLKKYESLGMKLCDATVGDWTAKAINLLAYLHERMILRIRGSSYIQADETTMKVLDKAKKGKTHLGYYWVYYAIEEKTVVFNYHPGRDQGAPKDFLQDFSGILQSDGYSAYVALKKKNDNIILAGCMAHARRHFFDAQAYKKDKAVWMLDKLQALYEIEGIARENNYTSEERLKLRQEKSIPILNLMKQWLDENSFETPKSPLGKAINYMKARWDKLILFASDGKLEIDNNLVENAIRPVALGRKNYLFAGSHEAAQRGAIIYSLIATCKLNGVDPYTWLMEVLEKLPDTKSSDLDSLFPKTISEKVSPA